MRVWLTFYKTLAIPLIGISLICALQVLQSQSVYFVFRVFWVKILTSTVIGVYIILFRSSQFIFFNNLGYTRVRLLMFALLFDLLIWLLLMLITASVL